MAETADGIGDIVTGGLVAHALDGAQGAAGHDPHEGAGGACLNCGAVRAGPFCQACGQSGHVHRNVAALGHDILHGVFHFEGRIWKTLPMLAFHPGELTRRYVQGERAKFVSPMALFLFSVFLLFAAVNRVSMPDVASATQGMAKVQSELGSATDKARTKLEDLQEKRSDTLSDDPKANTADLDRRIKQAQADVDALTNIDKQVPQWTGKQNGDAAATSLRRAADQIEQASASSATGLGKQIEHVRDNPALYAYKLKMASYKFSWALIPISVPFIWLLFFWRRDVGLYDHAIFAFHSLSFMTLFVVGLIGLYLAGIASPWLWIALLIVPPVHMYVQLRGAYGIGRFGAAWRTLALLSMTGITSLLFFLLLLWLEAE